MVQAASCGAYNYLGRSLRNPNDIHQLNLILDYLHNKNLSEGIQLRFAEELAIRVAASVFKDEDRVNAGRSDDLYHDFLRLIHPGLPIQKPEHKSTLEIMMEKQKMYDEYMASLGVTEYV